MPIIYTDSRWTREFISSWRNWLSEHSSSQFLCAFNFLRIYWNKKKRFHNKKFDLVQRGHFNWSFNSRALRHSQMSNQRNVNIKKTPIENDVMLKRLNWIFHHLGSHSSSSPLPLAPTSFQLRLHKTHFLYFLLYSFLFIKNVFLSPAI